MMTATRSMGEVGSATLAASAWVESLVESLVLAD
jgi:hypothetical protein